MQLYYAADSIALAAHAVLAESGLPYTLARVDHHSHMIEDGRSYLTISPNGYVPALELDDGTVLTEVLAIIQLVADRAPAGLLCPPPGQVARYVTLQWTSYVATEIHQKFMRFTQPDLTPAQNAAIVELLKQRVGHAERRLAESPYLAGGAPTMADIFLYVAMRWFRYHDVGTVQWPHLDRYLTVIGGRPGVAAALAKERLA